MRAEDTQQHHRVMTTTNAARTAAIALHEMMTAKKSTMTGNVMIEAVVAIAHAAPPLIQSTAVVAATGNSTALPVRTATAAGNIVVATGRALLLKRASTTTIHMSMATETRNLARDVSTEAIRTSTVTGHATRSVSETGVIAENGRKTTTTTARRIGRKTRIRSVGADVTVRPRKKSATMMTRSIVHLDGAARTGIERTAGATSAARTNEAIAIVRRKRNVLQKTM